MSGMLGKWSGEEPMPLHQIPLRWGAKVDPAFRVGVIQMGRRLGLDPNELMAVMAFETGETFDPAEKGSIAVGLIQFTRVAADRIGTTQEELVKMTRLEQLAYVEKFLTDRRYQNVDGSSRITSMSDLYMAVHWPAGVGKPEDYIMYSSSDPGLRGRAYRLNSPLDVDRNGSITKAEAAAKVAAAYERGLGYVNR